MNNSLYFMDKFFKFGKYKKEEIICKKRFHIIKIEKELSKAYAPANGTVYLYNYASVSDYGNMAIIDHGIGVYSILAHLESFNMNLKSGKKVKVGDEIGIIGNTSKRNTKKNSLPAHLHWSVTENVSDGIFNSIYGTAAIFNGKFYTLNKKVVVDPQKYIDNKIMEYPAIGRITSWYGPRDLPKPYQYHCGVDFSVKIKRTY